MAANEMTFEAALKKLEELVARMEAGELSLDESLKSFEEGVKLSRFCEKKLDEAEKKVEILMKDRDGRLKPVPFLPPDSEDAGDAEEPEEDEGI